MTRIQTLRTFIAASTLALTAPVMAETAMPAQQPQPQTQAMPAGAQPAQPMAPGTKTTVNGLQLKPDGGSGPDKSKFNIVSKKEAAKQQAHLREQNGGGTGAGSNGMTSDGTGGGENSSGN